MTRVWEDGHLSDAAHFDGEKWVVDWEQVRKNKLTTGIGRPSGWPGNVVPISSDGLSLIGVDPATNQFYWDGQPLVTEKRWGSVERRIAYVSLAIAFIGVAATVVQAWAAVTPLQSGALSALQVCIESSDDQFSGSRPEDVFLYCNAITSGDGR